MRLLFVGHNTARTTLSPLGKELRQSGHTVSCYFDDHLNLMNEQRGFPDTDFLLLGLCRNSRIPQSAEYKVELDVLQRAIARKIPVGVVCDADGHVSAPYLVRHGSSVRLVIALEQNAACNPTDFCEKAVPLYLPDIVGGADAIAESINQIVRPRARRHA